MLSVQQLGMQLESAAGTIVMTVLGGFIAVAAGLTGLGLLISQQFLLGAVAVGVAFIAVPLELALVLELSRANRARLHPVALAVALKHPIVPLLVRPLVALWWMGHFLVAIAATLAFILISPTLSSPNDMAFEIVIAVFCFAFTLGLGYASFGYLLLAVSTMVPDPDAIDHVWRHRIYVNVLLAVISTVAALMA